MEDLIKLKEEVRQFDLKTEDRRKLNLFAEKALTISKKYLNTDSDKRKTKEKEKLLMEYAKNMHHVLRRLINYEVYDMANSVKRDIITFIDRYVAVT